MGTGTGYRGHWALETTSLFCLGEGSSASNRVEETVELWVSSTESCPLQNTHRESKLQ